MFKRTEEQADRLLQKHYLTLLQQLDARLLQDLAHPRYRAFMSSDCIGEGVLSKEQANRHLAVTIVQTKDGTIRYNDTFGGKQLNVYGAPFLKDKRKYKVLSLKQCLGIRASCSRRFESLYAWQAR